MSARAARQPEELRLFRAVEGVQFHHGPNAYGFEAGYFYDNGRGAVRIIHTDTTNELRGAGELIGECVCNLTINLANADMPNVDEYFFVRDHELGRLRKPLLELGLFEEYGYRGNAYQYSLWTFKLCGEHFTRRLFAVECPSCRERWAQAHTQFLANDTIRRLATLRAEGL